MSNILYIDDEQPNLDVFYACFFDRFNIFLAGSGQEGSAILQQHKICVVITDQRMPGETGTEFIKREKENYPDTVFMILSGYLDFDTVKESLEIGRVYRFLLKPWKEESLGFEIDNAIDKYYSSIKNKQLVQELEQKNEALNLLQQKLQDEVIYLRNELNDSYNNSEIVTYNAQLKGLLEQLKVIASTNASVLITGETGTGKELIARAIHKASNNSGPFISVNCAAIPDSLIENELFGHEAGAYTDAKNMSKGKFELANNGTIFLDEIGEMPMLMQTKLLRVLQENVVERIGGKDQIQLNLRVIAATNRDVNEEIKNGRFRLDLYYRLNIFQLNIPPLRERRDDIPVLINHFIAKFNKKYGKNIKSILAPKMAFMKQYDWPGNVRELENVIERGVIISSNSNLNVDQLIFHDKVIDEQIDLTLTNVERKHILKVLEKTSWKIGGEYGAAELLGLKRTTLLAKMKKLNITKEV